jgi:hypothetical protein
MSDLIFLKRYAIGSTTLIVLMAASAFVRQPQKQKFGEIDVERINIVEPDGKLRMVISNTPRSIGPIYKGKAFGYPGGSRPGIIFFNDEGSENGGLSLGGRRMPDGTYRAGSQLAFDQFDQDQILYLSYDDRNGRRRTGLTVADRATVPLYDLVLKRDSINKMTDSSARTAALQQLFAPVNGVPMQATRVWLGKEYDKTAVVNLNDAQGKTRLRLSVDSLGGAKIEFLDGDGKVTSRIPSGS